MLGYNYVSTDIRYEKEAWVYPVVSFIAELGGSLGLFVGFSFLTFWDCLDFLLVKYNYQLEWDGLSKLRIESLRFYQLVNIIIRKIQEIFHLKHRPHAHCWENTNQNSVSTYFSLSNWSCSVFQPVFLVFVNLSTGPISHHQQLRVSLPFLYEGRVSIWRKKDSYIIYRNLWRK